MLIKHKLITNTAVSIAGMLAMLVLMNFSSQSLQEDITLAQNIGKIEAGILQLRSSEKDFLARKQDDYISKFNNETDALQKSIRELKDGLAAISVSANETMLLSNSLNRYQQSFSEVAETQRRIGFNPQSGFYGQLRSSASEAEEAIGDSVMFFKMMLQLRNSEKNYMLLLDDRYINKFQEDFALLHKNVKKSYLVKSQKNLILNALDSYNSAFLSLVSEQKKLGYHAEDGLQNLMNESAQEVTKIQALLVTKTDAAIENYISSINMLTYILFAVALLISIFIGIAISRNVMASILHIKDSIVRITETNDLTISVSTKSDDELADVAKSFNYMLTNFQSLLVSVKKSEENTEKATEILAENPLWADFIYEECLEGDK